jgi:phosphohistidine phosphatase
MISSPARRAMDTCTIIASALNYPMDAIKTDERLYLPGSTEFLEVIRGIDDTRKHIAVFSHNPGITHFANRLNNTDIENIPTCGMVHCFLDISQWKDLDFAKGRMLSFDYPKNKR